MADCGATSPEGDVCVLPQGACGANHAAQRDGRAVSWPNEDFVRPVRLEATDLRALASRTTRTTHARPIPPRPVFDPLDTSREAYVTASYHFSANEERIMGLLREEPLTCDEIEQRTGLSHQTASSRVRALKDRGFIIESGERRPTRTGSKANVMRIA